MTLPVQTKEVNLDVDRFLTQANDCLLCFRAPDHGYRLVYN
jgi:hypothetical protein